MDIQRVSAFTQKLIRRTRVVMLNRPLVKNTGRGATVGKCFRVSRKSDEKVSEEVFEQIVSDPLSASSF